MATALLTINADARNALNTINQLQQALNNLQNNANLIFGGGNNLRNQFAHLNRGITELTSLTNSWAAAISKSVTSALRSAFQEIKNIDDELVTIRRVTGRTGSELDALTAKATNVAKTYGTAASDYLKSVSSFSKAGYGDAADYLGELSVKAQRVGDLSQKVADQFLLAVDKGYQFNGSIEQLSAVLDGANEIGNRFATDIDQIAAGLGKVAPIAAQAHVSIYELEAALGTISAVTQRSGTEAATALRALFLNIMGDTKTEIEDGAKWTAGEIEGLQDLLKIYASDVVEAAQRTGEVINPMEAIAALSKAFREGVLTEQALVSMVSDIGGKLRTTQLLALIQNWDMYTAMVETATNATGSADKEIENSLDSITVKMNQLKSTWVDMVSDTVNSRFIKNIIDFATHALNSFGGLVPILSNIVGILATLRGYRIAESFRSIFQGIRAGGLSSIISVFGILNTALTALFTIINNGSRAAREQITSFADTAREAGNTSDSIYELYMTVREAAPGTDEYTSALARLAEQMQLTGNEAKSLALNIDEATGTALAKAVETAQVAYNELESKLKDKNLFSNAFSNWETISKKQVGSLTIETEKVAQEIRDIISRNLGGLADGFKDGHYTLFDELIPSMSVDELIRTYEALKTAYEELGRLSVENPAFKDLQQSDVYKDVVSMMDVLQDLYDQANAAAEALASSKINLALYNLLNSGTMNKWTEFSEEIKSGAEVTDDAIKTVLQSMVDFVEQFDDGSVVGRYVKEGLIQRLAEQFPVLSSYIEDWKEAIEDAPKNGVSETADKATDSAKQLTEALSEATKAKNEFDKAMEVAEENEGFKNYKEAYELYAQEMEEGRVNSRKAKAAAKYLLGDERYSAAYSSGGYKGVNAAMKSGNFDLLYGEESGDYAEGFFKFLTKYANQAGEIVDANGRVISSMALVGEAVNFQIADIEALSAATGLSIGQIGAASDALGVYGTVVFKQVEDLKSALAGLQGVSEGENGILNIDFDALKNQLDLGDLMSDEWKSLKQAINLANELGKVALINVAEGWLEADDAMERANQSAESELEDQKQASDDAKEKADALAKEAEEAANLAKEASAALDAEMKAIADASKEAQTQIASINEVLATIKATLGEEAAALFLQSLQTAATNAGADIVVTEGAITELKGVGGQPMSWEMLNSLISTAGNCNSALSEIGGKIEGFKDIPDIVITAIDDGATKTINTVAQTADEKTLKRTIQIGAKGISGEFETVKKEADDVTTEVLFFSYGADSELDELSIKSVVASAEDVTKVDTLKFHYGVDGHLETGESETQLINAAGDIVEDNKFNFTYGIDGTLQKGETEETLLTAAGGVAKKRFYFTYGINGELDTANSGSLYTDAEGVTTGVEYNFEYGTDGHLIKSSRTKIRALANGVVDNVKREFVYSANETAISDTISRIKTTAENATSETDKLTFFYNANGDHIPVSAEHIRESAGLYAKEEIYFHYDAAWNKDGETHVISIGETADKIAEVRTIKFDANGDAVSTDVKKLTGKVTGLAKPDPYMIKFQTDGDKVLTTIGQIEDAIKGAQEAAAKETPTYNFGTSGEAETEAEVYGPPLPPNWGEKGYGGVYGPRNATLGWPTENDFQDSILGQLVEKAFGEEAAKNPLGIVATPPSFVDTEQVETLQDAEEAVTGLGGAVETLQDWAYHLTNAEPPSFLEDQQTEVEVTTNKAAEDLADVVAEDGKTIKVGADITAKGETEQLLNALSTDEDDESTITRELNVEASDQTQELLDGSYFLGPEEDVDIRLDISTDENGNRLFTLLEQGTDNNAVQTVFTVTGDGLIEIKEIKTLVDGLEEEKEIPVTADTAAATSNLSRLLSRLNQLKSKAITVTANVKGGTGTTTSVGVNGSTLAEKLFSSLGISSNATGNKYFAGGLSLVNEEGPELVTANGWAEILGSGEPTIANIPKGATIYTAKETAKILNGANGQTSFPAFATGLLDAWSKVQSAWNNSVAGKAVNSALSPIVDSIKNAFGVGGTVTIPEKKKEEEKKKTTSSGGGSSKTTEAEFWDVIQEYINYGLKKIQYQLDDRQEAITALERERDKLMQPIDNDLDDLNWQIEEAEYRIKLIERQRDDATKALNEQIDALKEARDIEEEEEALEEKRLAVIEAETALKDAQYDRTVRYFNEESGQWEWMADQSAVKDAEDALKDAQEAYDDAMADYQISQLERQVAAIEEMYEAQMKPYQDQVETYNRKVEDLQYQRDKIEKEYADSIDPLMEAMEEIQQSYDDLSNYYSRVQDAVGVPTSDLDAALTALQSADENYSSQFDNVSSLLDALYDLAPTWSAINPGTLGVSAASGAISNTNFADVLNNSGTTIVINGLTVEGDGSMSLNELIAKAGIYRNYNE